MNWLIVLICFIPAIPIFALIVDRAKRSKWFSVGLIGLFLSVTVVIFVGIPLMLARYNVIGKYNWYTETRSRYERSTGYERILLEVSDVATYNIWYERNFESLNDPWSLLSSTGLKFDYIITEG